MSLLKLSIVLLALFPVSAHAQSALLKELTGAWVRLRPNADQSAPKYDTLYIFADSTYRWDMHKEPKAFNYLKGDTISFYETVKFDSWADPCGIGYGGMCGLPGYKIAIKGKELLLETLDGTNPWEGGIYTRVEAPKSMP